MPSIITDGQKNILLNWINEAYNTSKIGIIKYNKETNKKEIVANDNITKEEIIELLNNFNSKKIKTI